MTIAVTGAAGFTGRHLFRAAARLGKRAVAMRSDITDRYALAAELAALAPTHVLHLAGISNVAHADPRDVYEVNVVGSVNLLEASAALPVRPLCIVLASSATVYGPDALLPVNERAATRPVTHYAVSKVAMEMAARLVGERLPVVLARPFNYTGPGQSTNFLVPKLVQHFQQRAATIQLGSLDVEREFNDVRFVCDAYLQLLDRGIPGETYNLSTGRATTINAIVDALSALTGHAPEIVTVPDLVRPNEIRALYGDPARLVDVIGPLQSYSLQETLRWMLETSVP